MPVFKSPQLNFELHCIDNAMYYELAKGDIRVAHMSRQINLLGWALIMVYGD